MPHFVVVLISSQPQCTAWYLLVLWLLPMLSWLCLVMLYLNILVYVGVKQWWLYIWHLKNIFFANWMKHLSFKVHVFNSFALRMCLIYWLSSEHIFLLNVCTLVDRLILYPYFLMIFSYKYLSLLSNAFYTDHGYCSCLNFNIWHARCECYNLQL